MDRICAVIITLCAAATLCHPRVVEAQARDCPPGWRWEPSRDRCESPCVPSLWQQEAVDLSEVIGAAEAQQQCRALWDRAEQFAELEAHEAAAETFAELYRDHRHQCQDVEGRCMGEVLLRAGQHYRAARRFGRAIEVLQRLVEEYGAVGFYLPADRPPPVVAAWLELGECSVEVAAYQRAAVAFARYVHFFPEAPNAPAILQRGLWLATRAGDLGVARRRALTLLERVVAGFIDDLPRRPERSRTIARLWITLGEAALLEERHAQAARHLGLALEWLEPGAAPASRAVALTERGRALEHLGPDHRDEATSAYAEAVRLVEAIERGVEPVDDEVVEAGARARFALAERARARFVTLELPPPRLEGSLRLEVRHWWAGRQTRAARGAWDRAIEVLPEAERRRQLEAVQMRFWRHRHLRPWLARSEAALARAARLYRAAGDSGVAEVEVAAAARRAEMHHRLVAAAPVAGATHRRRAIDLYQRGLATARRRHWSGSWSRRCQRGLRRLSPSSFPLDDEITATPSYLSSRLALPSMIERR